jgi:hypothetical protein
MGLRAVFAAAVPNIFVAAGEDAVFYPSVGDSVECKIFIDFDVMLQPAGVETQVWNQGTTIEALLSEDEGIGIGTTEPDRGETFVYDGITYTVQAVIANDGLTVKMQVT